MPACPLQVTAIFGSSAEVLISLWGETPDVGVMFHCGDAYATVVSGEGAGGSARTQRKQRAWVWQCLHARWRIPLCQATSVLQVVAVDGSDYGGGPPLALLCPLPLTLSLHLSHLPPVNSHKKPVDIPFELAPQSQAEQLRLRLAVQKRTERLAIREK